MKEIILSDFVKTKSRFGGTDPWSIFFVYSKRGNFIIKGMSREVEKYIHDSFDRAFCRYTFWQNGMSRGFWRFWGADFYFGSSKVRNRRKNTIYTFLTIKSPDCNGEIIKRRKECTLMTVRNIPKRWLPIFDYIIDNNYELTVKQFTNLI